ncbi:hypothetical protein [Coleofasciculus sp. F4-SAH-05]|uniref:hypothetical protein n=1 Tax=Coleofasciculus sp. F4-SAH-05 TaxID=3069525 RepID=UPI004064B4E8
MSSLYTNLLTHNEDYNPDYRLDGDPVVGIKLERSFKHFIKDDASPSYTYTSYFYVINKLPVSLLDVSVFISTGETPDQPNVQTQFLSSDGQWRPSAQIEIGHIEPQATSLRQTFTIQIVRVLPAGSLNNFQLNYYYNPTYKVAYSNNQDLWNAPSQVIVQ